MTELTALQTEAFRLAGDGLTHEEIGERMGVTASMSKQHLAAVRKKLGIGPNKRFLIPAARDYFKAST